MIDQMEDISTHTPLAGRDKWRRYKNGMINISTHTPLAGRDYILYKNVCIHPAFLLTRPSQGVTVG